MTLAIETKPQVKITVEPFSKIAVELAALTISHFEEATLDKDNQKADLDWNQFVALDKAGMLHCIAARCDGKLVGYFINVVMWHMHHFGLKTSASNLLYVLPQYRKGTGAGIGLIRAAQKELKAMEVQKMYIGVRISNLGELLEGLDFRPIETTFSKWIGD